MATTRPDLTKMTGLEAAQSLGSLTGLGRGHNTPIQDIQAALMQGLPISEQSWAQAGFGQEDQYNQLQLQLAQKQLDMLDQQNAQQQDYMTAIKPQMEAQTQLMQQALAEAKAGMLSPEDKQLQADAQRTALSTQQKSNELLQQQITGQQDLAPLQKQLLEQQLKQALAGNEPTAEQIAQIDAATNAAREGGISDISAYSGQALQQLRDTLAPSLGLRPTDTPILDRGALVEREATRQAGQLTSALAGANANARLNYPLASQQITGAISQNTANIGQATQDFQAQLAQAAATNRLNLLNSGTQATGLGLQTGLGVLSNAAPRPIFQPAQPKKQSTFWSDLSQGLAGAGQLVQGAGAAYAASDIRLKEDVQTLGYSPRGHRWVKFKYKGDPKKLNRIGVIAQEAAKIDPEHVYTNGLGIKYVDYGKLRA